MLQEAGHLLAATQGDTGAYDGDRELVGQGLASIAAGFFGGMPATGAIARTAVNARSGARTRVAAIVHSLFLLVVVSAAGTIVSRIPLAALAGVLMVTACRMVSPATVRQVTGATRAAAVLFVLTAIITVSVDLIFAIGIGLAAAAVITMRTMARAAGVHREELPGPVQPGDEHIALFRIEGSLFFAAADRVLDRVASIQDVDVVILRLSQVQVLDASGAEVLHELVAGLERRGVTVLVKGIRSHHLALARRVGVIDALSQESHLFDDLEPAVGRARELVALRDREPTAGATSVRVSGR